MARTPLNALQAILIRERLIVCFEIRKSELKKYNVRKLIEDIATSIGNEGEAQAYQEDKDREDEGERFDAALSLKHSTVDNLLNRRSSAISDDNLRLICNFLLTESYLSAETLAQCGKHPDLRLRAQFSGIAPTDPRLQRHRRALEGEYHAGKQVCEHSIWVAEPGRSKPFVSLRISNPQESSTEKAQTLYEGRIFLMPADTTMIVEVSKSEGHFDCCLHRLGINNDAILLHHEARDPIIVSRLCRENYRLARSVAYNPPVERPHIPMEGLKEALWYKETARMPTPEHLAQNAALLRAAREGDLPRLIAALLDGANINIQDRETGRTAMHLAASRADVEMALWLSNAGLYDVSRIQELLPATELTDAMIQNWRYLSNARYVRLSDHDGCLCSAMAPVSTDDSDRNRRATNVWQMLLREEATMLGLGGPVNPLEILELWQPSSIMADAFQRYAAPLPDDFEDPIPD